MTIVFSDARTLGERLQLERARLGLTLAAMAEAGGVSKATQINFERGTTTIHCSYLNATYESVGLDQVFVLTGCGPGERAEQIDWDLLRDVIKVVEEFSSKRKRGPLRATVKPDLIKAIYLGCVRQAKLDERIVAATLRLVA